jgi:hypothetical protein
VRYKLDPALSRKLVRLGALLEMEPADVEELLNEALNGDDGWLADVGYDRPVLLDWHPGMSLLTLRIQAAPESDRPTLWVSTLGLRIHMIDWDGNNKPRR